MQPLLDDPDFLNQSEELLEFYRQYPEIAALDLLRVKLSSIQKVVLRSMWFRDYVMAIMCRGSGKCVSGDTYLFTTRGIKQIGKQINDLEILSDAQFSVSNGYSLFPAQKIYNDGIKPTNCFTTRYGYSISTTDDHPLMIMNIDGNIGWKKSADVRKGDFLVVSRGDNTWGYRQLEPDYAYYLGLLVGDGCLSRDNVVIFTNEDTDLLKAFQDLSEKFFEYRPCIKNPKNRARHSIIYSKNIRQKLIDDGLDISLSPTKKFPNILLDASRESVVAFLQGLFDTDGGVYVPRGQIHYCSASKELIRLVHLCLLNLGIVSGFRKKKDAWVIEIQSEASQKFADIVNFRCIRKEKALKHMLLGRKFNTNVDILPHQQTRFGRLYQDTKKLSSRKTRQDIHKRSRYFDISYQKLEDLLPDLPEENKDVKILQYYNKHRFFFDPVKSISYQTEKVYDLCMPLEAGHAFVGNGIVNHNTFINAVFACLKAILYPGHRVGLLAPTFRQSKFMFDECTRLYHLSPIMQNACERKPTTQSDNCYIRFKSTGTKNPSMIQSIPLGDGTKIRGSRFYTIICDEFPHIPPEIFNMVIRPMAATVADPMENVEKVARQKELLAKGLMTQKEIEEDTVTNQIIITSSGYFTFNHMYKLYQAYKREMESGNGRYAVFRVPYWLLPDGFLEKNSIEAAKREMSSLEFRMEYEAAFIPDTDAFYKASLLELCSNTGFSTQVAGITGTSYCLGVDPARNEDSFAICVAELGVPSKIVHAVEIQKMPFPKMVEVIEDLCDAFNIQSIYMDAGGGGLAIKDILAENNRHHRAGPILDPDDELHQTKAGRHILTMCNFGSDFISESNFAALRLLEHRDLLFPSIPREEQPTPVQEESWQTIQEMKNQMQMIEITETPTGKHHFDVPKGEGHGKQKKDLYTSFMLAARCVYDHLWAELMPESIMCHGGVVHDREEMMPYITSDGISVTDVPEILRDKLEMAQDPEGYRQKMLAKTYKGRKVITSSAAVLKPVLKTGMKPRRNRPVNQR